MAAIEIRHADPADAGAIARLLHDFNVEFDAPTPPVETLATRCGELLRDAAMVVCGGARGLERVGLAGEGGARRGVARRALRRV